MMSMRMMSMVYEDDVYAYVLVCLTSMSIIHHT